MNRYIIKNCPTFIVMRTATSGTYFDICGNAKGHIKCKDCTNCVLKQIVEECKHACLAEKHLIHKSSTFNLANGILQKLDIQEVE